MTEPASEPKYTYPTSAEFETDWIETHRRHRVVVGAGNWLQCKTCGSPVKLVTRDAYTVLREIST